MMHHTNFGSGTKQLQVVITLYESDSKFGRRPHGYLRRSSEDPHRMGGYHAEVVRMAVVYEEKGWRRCISERWKR